MRERDNQSLTLAPLRARRGRSFFERLRQVGRAPAIAPDDASSASPAPRATRGYDFLEAPERSSAERNAAQPAFAGAEAEPSGEPLDVYGAAEQESASYAARALDVFNASEFPRRVAGVARSLGAAQVNVRSAEHLESVIVIVVAWELCWYRYQVDLSEELPEARVVAQGTELSELEREEHGENAVASESGLLALTRP